MSARAVCSFCGQIRPATALVLAPSRKGLCLTCTGPDLLHALGRVHSLESRMGLGHGVEHFVAKRLDYLMLRRRERRARGRE